MLQLTLVSFQNRKSIVDVFMYIRIFLLIVVARQ